MASSDTELYEPPRRSARLRKDRGGLVNEEPPKSKSKPAKKQVNKNHNFQAEKHTEFPDEYSGQPSDVVDKSLYNNPQPRDFSQRHFGRDNFENSRRSHQNFHNVPFVYNSNGSEPQLPAPQMMGRNIMRQGSEMRVNDAFHSHVYNNRQQMPRNSYGFSSENNAQQFSQSGNRAPQNFNMPERFSDLTIERNQGYGRNREPINPFSNGYVGHTPNRRQIDEMRGHGNSGFQGNYGDFDYDMPTNVHQEAHRVLPQGGRLRQNGNKIKPPAFDGSYEEWPYFKRLFLEASNLNNWDNQERFYNLLNSLQGDAKTFIISMEGQLNYLTFEQLLQMMEHRFGVGDRSSHFQSLLEGRHWKWGDNLRTYQDEIRRLVSLAFPEVQGWSHQEILVKKYFINGITDFALKQRLLVDPPSSLEAAVQYCERYISAKTAVDAGRRQLQKDRVRMVRPEEEYSDDETDSEEEDIVNILKENGYIPKQKGGKPFKGSKFFRKEGKQIKCFNCSGYGHIAKACPSPLNSKGSRTEAGDAETYKKEQNQPPVTQQKKN